VNLRLLWILLQMFCCWVWFRTEAFDTKSNQRSPSNTSQAWHLEGLQLLFVGLYQGPGFCAV